MVLTYISALVGFIRKITMEMNLMVAFCNTMLRKIYNRKRKYTNTIEIGVIEALNTLLSN
jgi:low temperature requirement protein LtrA